MTTHIALLGRTPEPVLKGIHHYGDINNLHILHSPNSENEPFGDIAAHIVEQLSAVSFNNVVLHEIDAFNMQNVIDTILSIVDKGKSPFYINITGGTNLMAGAACTSAFFVGAKAYYVLDSFGREETSVVELPFPNIPYYKVITPNQVSILEELSKFGGWANNSELRDSLSLKPQLLSHHIKTMEKEGLLTIERGGLDDKRKIIVRLTNSGNFVLRWRILEK